MKILISIQPKMNKKQTKFASTNGIYGKSALFRATQFIFPIFIISRRTQMIGWP